MSTTGNSYDSPATTSTSDLAAAGICFVTTIGSTRRSRAILSAVTVMNRRIWASAQFQSILFLTLLYSAIVSVTHYTYFGDTTIYVRNILLFNHDPVAGQRVFWDFGHLLWRPLGWLLLRLFGGALPYTKTGEYNLSLAVLLIATSVISGFITILLFRSLAVRFLNQEWAAMYVATTFLCFHAFLNYVQTGTPYIVGLMCLTLSLWSTVRTTETGAKGPLYALLSGVLAALAVLFWFPYILAIPGVLASFLLWPTHTSSSEARRRAVLAGLTLASASVLICMGYFVPLIQLHIHSIGDLRDWAIASSHAWGQNRRVLRIASGLPRSFVWIGNEGMLIKRYLLHDPYAHVSLWQVLSLQVWLIVGFYVFSASVLWILTHSISGRRILQTWAAAGIPVLVFAVVIFEPGSMERYLPVYPFLCLAVAFCLSRWRQNRIAVSICVACMSIAILVNVSALRRSSVLKKYQETADRARSLANKVGPSGVIALFSQNDELYSLASSFPFDPVVRKTSLPVYDVIALATSDVREWRRHFALRVVQAFGQRQSVWVSKRLFAAEPHPDWGWNEGDDPDISWRELRPFFRCFHYSADVGGTDGFVQVADSGQNRAFLNQILLSRARITEACAAGKPVL
jgi:hypothetical protein